MATFRFLIVHILEDTSRDKY